MLDRIEDAGGVEFGEDDARQPRRERHDTEPGAPDMRAGHRDEYRLVILPFGIGHVEVGRMLAPCEEIGVDEHRALWLAGGPGSITLKHRIVTGRGRKGRAGPPPAHRAPG